MNSNLNKYSFEEKMAYAAGYIDGRGTLGIQTSSSQTQYIKLVIRSSSSPTSVMRLAEMLELSGRTNKNGATLTISGAPLHDLMKKLWPYLGRDRKLEYQQLRLIVNPVSNKVTDVKGQTDD